MDRALGLIEVIGYPPAIEAADAALKAANIKLGGITKVGSGIMTIQLFGDVGAIKAAVEAGGKSASRIGKVRATHIIPRVDESLINSNILANIENSKIKSRSDDEINVKAVVKNGITEESISNTVEEATTVKEPEVKDDKDNHIVEKDSLKVDKDNHIVEKDSLKVDKDNHIVEKDSLKVEKDNLIAEKDNLKERSISEVNHEKAAEEESVLNGISLEDLKNKSVTELRTLIQSLRRPINTKKLNSAKKDDLIRYITDYMDRKKGEV